MSRILVAFVVLGALLDVLVFSFQSVQYGQIQNNSVKSDCWSKVLDDALKHPLTKEYHAHLVHEATRCARLPPH